MRRPACFVVSAALAVVSCKSAHPNTSNAQSLDNFAAGGRMVVNHCGFTPTDVGASGTSASLQAFISAYGASIDVSDGGGITVADVAKTLDGIPGYFLSMYFDPSQVGGQIKVTHATPQVCQADLDPTLKDFDQEGQATNPIMSCRFVNDQRPVIYVDANTDALGHSLVRAIGLVISEELSHVQVANNQRSLATAAEPGFVKDMVSLAAPFIDQMKTSADPSVQAKMAKMIGVPDLTSKTSDQMAQLLAVGSGDAQTFLQILYAEAFDSYYCSSDTRANAQTGFSTAFVAFAKIHQQVMAGLQLPTLQKLQAVPADGSPRAQQAAQTAAILKLFNGPPNTANDVPGTAGLALDGAYYYYPQTVYYYYPQTYAATDYGYSSAYYTPQATSTAYSYDGSQSYYSGYQPGFFNSVGRGAVGLGRFLTFQWGKLGACGGQWDC